jgi:hypothetical protein
LLPRGAIHYHQQVLRQRRPHLPSFTRQLPRFNQGHALCHGLVLGLSSWIIKTAATTLTNAAQNASHPWFTKTMVNQNDMIIQKSPMIISPPLNPSASAVLSRS